MRLFSLFLIFTDVVLAGSALTLEPYSDESAYWQQLSNVPYGDDAAFIELRTASLTPRFRLQDYEITLMAVGVIGFMSNRHGAAAPKSPRSKWGFILLAVALPLVTMGGFAFDILQAANRGECPPWGDAVMIALLGLPFLFAPLQIWSLIHLAFFWPYGKQEAVSLMLALSWHSNWWLLIVSVITAGLTIYCIILGYWWLLLPKLGWLYYYLSLAAKQRAALLGSHI